MLIYLCVIFGVLQILDGYTTIKAIDSGKGKEINPIMAYLFYYFGMINTLICKGVLLTILTSFITYKTKLYEVPISMLAIYAYVVINNVKVLTGK